LDKLWIVFKKSYEYLRKKDAPPDTHLIVKSLDELLKKYGGNRAHVLFQDNGVLEAFIIIKDTVFGKKICLSGAEKETKGARRKAVEERLKLLRNKEEHYYAEASDRPLEIYEEAGIPVIEDEANVRKLLKGKTFIWNGDGSYTRKVKNLGSVTKKLVGYPNL
jgi:hypothetical protein